MRIILLLVTIFILSFSRENPFKSVVDDNTKVVIQKKIFSSAKTKLPDSARVLKSVTLTYQNMDGSISTKVIKINQEIDWHYPIVLYQKRLKEKYQKVSFGFIKFYIKNRKILIYTKDKKLRDFFLISPYKFVIDFNANKRFLTKTKILNSGFIKRIVIGNHDGFYRVVMLLDGRYIYNIKKVEEGYIVEFK